MGYANSLDTGAFWWESIAGPARLVSDIESALADGQSIICNVTTSLSFRWVFRDTISHWLSGRDVMVEHIDCDNEYAGEDITDFLLHRIQPNAVTDYRRRRSAQYMRDKGILHGKLLWIRGVPAQYIGNWIQYISSYRSHDLEHGLMLLEVQSFPAVRIPQNLRLFDYSSYIQKDDLRLYASVLTENYLATESHLVKQYAVDMVSALCLTDGELANELLLRPDLMSVEPITLLALVVDENFSDSPRGRESWHPFALLRNEDDSELYYRIWSAQVRVGYPQIELERLNLVRNYYEEIKFALTIPFSNEKTGLSQRFTDYEGNLLLDPYDVEIGMLIRLSAVRKASDPNEKIFDILDHDTKDRIHLLRDCRNNLAHLKVCSVESFLALLTESG